MEQYVSWMIKRRDGRLGQEAYEPYHRIGYGGRTECGKGIPGDARYFTYAVPAGRCDKCEAGTFSGPHSERSYER